MFEFAQANWLWLFGFALLLLAAYLLARRFRRVRVTYGALWQAAARKLRPPAWKRWLRTVLTLLVSALLLGSVVLYAAGMQMPAHERTPPLVVAFALDCTPSTQARAGQSTRRDLAWQRLNQALSELGPQDRAVIFRFSGGKPLGSQWLTAADKPGELPPVDFDQPDLAALAATVKLLAPPDLPQVPQPVRFIWWLGDHPPHAATGAAPARLSALGGSWHEIHGETTLVETFGEPAPNDAITAVRWNPTPSGPGRGTIEVQTLSGRPASIARDGFSPLTGNRLELQAGDTSTLFSASVAPGDGLPQDDTLEFRLPVAPISRAHVCWPTEQAEMNPLLEEAWALLLPGVPVSNGAGTHVPQEAQLAVFDGVAPDTFAGRFALCLGALPAAWGQAGAPIDVAQGMQQAELSADPGFELPDLSLLHSRAALPLEQSSLNPLLRAPTGEVLVAQGVIGPTRILYVGFTPRESTLLRDTGGILLLMRWLASVRANPRADWPATLLQGQTADLHIGPNVMSVELHQSPWPAVPGATTFALHPGPDGRARLGPLPVPGLWRVHGHGEDHYVASVWRDDAEQSLHFQPLPRAELAALRPAQGQDWREALPGLLLWVALVLLVLEWSLWLTRITD